LISPHHGIAAAEVEVVSGWDDFHPFPAQSIGSAHPDPAMFKAGLVCLFVLLAQQLELVSRRLTREIKDFQGRLRASWRL
jgi:hypothetical protein